MDRARSGASYSVSPLAQAAISRDVEEDSEDSAGRDTRNADSRNTSSDSDESALRPDRSGRSMVSSYRRPSFTVGGPRATVDAGLRGSSRQPTKRERHEARREERSLLRDNDVIPPKHPQTEQRSKSLVGRVLQLMPSFGIPGGNRKPVPSDEEAAGDAHHSQAGLAETTPLLGNPELPYGGQAENVDQKFEDAVIAGKIKTTWQREAKVIGRYSAPLVLTFVLQYSLTVTSVFTVGHLGKAELGAVSLASMTANITGYAIYQGLATSLDTLCAQAYGSGHKKLVGLQTQRMVYFLCIITVPVGAIWLSADQILQKIVPEKAVAHLAGQYLKVILIGAPAYACYESGKRFLQAQGLFNASLYALLICAPLNALMHWLFVWRFGWGFLGAPIAVAITDILLPILLILYVRFIAGRACWPGLTWRAWHNWGPMVKLALPGLMMVEAEYFAFEILTLASSYFGTTHLAAQSVIGTIIGISFQFPFPVGIAGSTRIANLIGATLSDAAKTAAKVTLIAAASIGAFNAIMVSVLRYHLPRLFTSDPDVIALSGDILPIVAAFMLFDSLCANCNGILRGIGRQEIGGYVQLFCYYAVAMPISLGTGFGLGWELRGLWSGVAIALVLVFCIESSFLFRADWERSVEEAKLRNETE